MYRLNQLITALKLLCVLLAYGQETLAQQVQKAYPSHYYGPDEGLASSELHCLVQDKQGFLWIASDNGLIRFDGRYFRHYTSDDGLGNLVIFKIREYGDEGILCATLDNHLYLLSKDSVSSIPNNFIFQNQLSTDEMPNDLTVLDDGTIVLGSSGSGPIQVSPEGELYPIINEPGNGIYIKEFEDRLNVSSWKNGDSQTELNVILDLSSGKTKSTVSGSKLRKGAIRAVNWNEAILIGNGNELLCFKGNDLKFKQVFDANINAICIDERYGLLIGTAGSGVCRYSSMTQLENSSHELWMPGKSISDILVMADGEVFITTLNSGLAFIPSPEIEYIRSENGFSSIASGEDGVYIATKQNEIKLLVDALKDLVTTHDHIDPINSLFYDEDHGGLFISSYNTELLINGTNKKLFCNDSLSIGNSLKFFPGVNDRLWLAQRDGFACINKKSGECIRHSEDQFFRHRVLSIHEHKENKIWLGTADGLFYGHPDSLMEVTSLGTLNLKGRVEDIIQLNSDLLAFAVKGQGVIFYSIENQTSKLYDLSAGLISNIIEDLENNGDEELFIATTSGVQRLYLNGPNVLRSTFLNKNLGILSNEVNQIIFYRSALYAQGPKGISIIKSWPELDQGPRMQISALTSALGVSEPTSKLELNYPHNSLKIDFNGISFKEADKLIFRYRLQEDSTWYFTRNNSISISDLDPGEYELSLQVGNGLVWGDESSINFKIIPAAWQSWWAKVILYVFGAFLLYLFGRWVFSRLRKDDILEKRLGQLERSALLAQMNPHFVFNSLNSIQSYITKNENDRAIRFLAKFSRLIRSTLNHSRAPRVNLQSELEALRLYLDLEQMRFKNKFDYEITVDKDIDPYDFMLPPLLIQPYLENAIIHGLSKKDGKGRIELFYMLQKNQLVVTVTDNGIGIEQSKKQKEGHNSLHKSVGMTITQKRLELLDENREDKKVSIEEVKDKEGKVLGTKVEVKIKINQEEIS